MNLAKALATTTTLAVFLFQWEIMCSWHNFYFLFFFLGLDTFQLTRIFTVQLLFIISIHNFLTRRYSMELCFMFLEREYSVQHTYAYVHIWICVLLLLLLWLFIRLLVDLFAVFRLFCFNSWFRMNFIIEETRCKARWVYVQVCMSCGAH